MARPGRVLLVVAAAVLGLRCCFVPSPESRPKVQVGINAATAALPWMLMAQEAQAKYDPILDQDGNQAKWGAIMVPLFTLVLPAAVMGGFTLYFLSDEFLWQDRPETERYMAYQDAMEDIPMMKGRKETFYGMVNMDDYEKGLHEAWEAAKPPGSTVTVKDKMKEMSTMNAPLFNIYRKQYDEKKAMIAAGELSA
mmetsp:Transcript_83686/g.148043  ORF Transcript_83686/g.148043 Transcript_83686/m.148043 type:complete len:195 (-) Transcript_83686:243-827(-)|eukprot:CAMPEP_0197621110 /NCGR_PEP_ID=MMETSP1338-20131121/1735_1 /TAXON_ID=43686 ORGANISM="Pelagodinium beii, Strain RCC1491" /NCGR_SAMPLE_ID=MMETSP1338 /ASSEMBLY_ACC=CAM_ASM_000754 /LENGTH=194 /DNA_ID=CAMNT_0043190451 /DNA_START=67 /DNA_END=651 /DNA_ORIENTATION=-